MTKQKVNQTLPSFLLLQMSSRLSCLTFWRTFHTQPYLNFLPNFFFFFFKTSERREGQNKGTENTRLQFYYCWKRKTDFLMFLTYTTNEPGGNTTQSVPSPESTPYPVVTAGGSRGSYHGHKVQIHPEEVPLGKNCNMWSWHCFQWHLQCG